MAYSKLFASTYVKPADAALMAHAFQNMSATIRPLAPAGRAVPCATVAFTPAGPGSPKPVETYRKIDSQPMNRAIMTLFRKKMVAALGRDSDRQGYDAIVELTHRLNRYPTARETQAATHSILQSLFPAWLPAAFQVRHDNLLRYYCSQ